ncbi:hypothetical protein MASSI9I_80035 [Massilia sp. 9I]|nr:hypothetical protein MASSI9I_80035 [Massilia sp. 9I]
MQNGTLAEPENRDKVSSGSIANF